MSKGSYCRQDNYNYKSDPIASKVITIIEVIAGRPDIEAHSDLLSEGPKLHLGHPVGIMTDVLVAGSLDILPGNVLSGETSVATVQLREEHPQTQRQSSAVWW